MKKRNIMLVMSDQHGWMSTGFVKEGLDTPHLRRIAREGALFDHCYCNAPLCVPSRMSFLTGQFPSELGIFNNDSALASDVPTLAHEMGRLGYDTVLVGRMHFKGDDQKHGFDRRLYGDITSQYWGTGGRARKDFGKYAGTTNRLHCTEAVGGGVSPVMVYDEAVWRQAMEFLERWEMDHENRPLFLVVGFYGPHFPFACRQDLYEKYQSLCSVEECEQDKAREALPFYAEYRQECEKERVRNCRAAYWGLVEQLDGYVGALYDKFRQVQRREEHVFVYLSDHGEQLGKRGIFGKQTLYEDAVRVPLIMEGEGIAHGRFSQPVGLLDVSRTLLSLASFGDSKDFDWHQGVCMDLEKPDCDQHWIRIQQMLEEGGEKFLAEAAVFGDYKVIRAQGQWYVYDLKKDAMEEHSLLESCPGRAGELIDQAQKAGCFVEEEKMGWLIARERQACEGQKRLKEWGRAKSPWEWGTAGIPAGTLRGPAE